MGEEGGSLNIRLDLIVFISHISYTRRQHKSNYECAIKHDYAFKYWFFINIYTKRIHNFVFELGFAGVTPEIT